MLIANASPVPKLKIGDLVEYTGPGPVGAQLGIIIGPFWPTRGRRFHGHRWNVLWLCEVETFPCMESYLKLFSPEGLTSP